MAQILSFPQNDTEELVQNWLTEEAAVVGYELQEGWDYTREQAGRALIIYYHLDNAQEAEKLEFTGTPYLH